MTPDGYAVVQSDGAFVGIWRDRECAVLICNRSPSAKGERIEPMVFLSSVDRSPDPLGQALNEGNGTYRP